MERELGKVEKQIEKFDEKSYWFPSIKSCFPWFDNTKVHLFNETFPEKVWSLMLITLGLISEEDLLPNQDSDSLEDWPNERPSNHFYDVGVTNQEIFYSDSDNDISTMLHAPTSVIVCKQNRGTAALLGDSPSPSDFAW